MPTASAFLGATSGGAVVGGAVVRLFLDDDQFNRALATSEAKAKGSTTTMAGGFSKFGAIAKAGLIAAGLAAVGFAASSVRAFIEAEAVMAQTEAVIRSTGAAAGYTSQEIADMAQEFQNLTAFEDEAVQSAENILLTFRAIGHDAFPVATQAVLDISTALGTDLNGAAIQVGKALQDPVAGLTALRRVGVSFSAEQRKQIANLVESNDLMGAQKIILGELSTEFGGSAAAALDTYGGKWEQLKNKVDDYKESVGGLILGGELESDKQTFAMQILIQNLANAEEGSVEAQQAAEDLATGMLYLSVAEQEAANKANAVSEELTNFANMTADELESWQESATDSMTFVEAAFDDLGSAAHVSAAKILRSFEEALSAQADFEKNSRRFLGSVAKQLGPDLSAAAGEMVASLAEKGPEGAALMAALAGASAKMRKDILRDWMLSGEAARGYIGDLASVDAYLAGLTDKPHTINIEVITHYIETGKI